MIEKKAEEKTMKPNLYMYIEIDKLKGYNNYKKN